jgi:uroporphyrinogen decarboxylase
MNSRERLLTALNHQEPDRIPFDLGSTQVTGIHVVAYRHLRAHLGLPPVEPQLCDSIQQLALPDNDVIEQLGVDVRGLFPLNSHNWNIVNADVGEAWEYTDEWSITHRRLKPDQRGRHSRVQMAQHGRPSAHHWIARAGIDLSRAGSSRNDQGRVGRRLGDGAARARDGSSADGHGL